MNAMYILFGNLASIISIICATFLIYYDKSGWGWLIFLALCCSCSYDFKKVDENKIKKE